jgi:hypothetical protein
MPINDIFISKSIDLHLFYMRITEEHLLFIKSSLPGKYADLIEEIDILNEEAIKYCLNKVDIPAAENAALFLIANVETLKYCYQFIKLNNFELQSYTVIRPQQKGYGSWFLSCYDLLLFSTKGEWTSPTKENKFSGDIIQTYEDVYQVIEKMYPDVKSFYEVGKEKQRDGWGISLEYLNKPKVPEFKPLEDGEWKSQWQKQQESQKDDEEKDPDPNDLGRW